MRTFPASLVAAAAIAVLHGQQAPPVFRSGIDLVEVDVSVLDKDRFPVRDLTGADFTVLEDGKPRPIVTFTSVDLPEAEAEIAPAFRGAVHDVVSNEMRQEGRMVVLLMDRSIGLLQQRDARAIATGIIDHLGPGDLGAVVYSSGFAADSKYPQNFTADHARLLAAIDHSVFGMTSPPDMTTAGLAEGSGPSGEDYCQPRTLNAIANIAESLSEVPHRRKLLVIVGTRMTFITNDECALIVKMARERAFRALDVANMTVDAIDPTGLEYAEPRARAALLQRQGDLAVLPAMTGGRVVNSNRPLEQIPKLFQESRSYYLLAFQPAAPKADGRLHKIEVKVNRKGVRLQARRAYNAPAAAPTSDTPVVNATPLFAALAGALPASGISVTANAAAFEVPGKSETAVAIVAGIRSTPDVTGRAFEVMAGAFDPQGKQVGLVHQRTELTGTLASVGPIDVLSRLNLKPGLYEIRVAVAEADGPRAGSVFTWIEVPAFDQTPLALSGFALAATPAWPATPLQAIADLLPFPPTTKRTFGRGDHVTALLRVYQATTRPAAVLMTAHVVDQLGRTVVSDSSSLSAGRFRPLQGIDFRIDFPAAQFGPGDYLLTVDAAIGKRTARRDVRFRVQ